MAIQYSSRFLHFILALGLTIGLAACGNSVGSSSWNCEVSLRLDSVSGAGSGSGGSRDEALRTALETACSKLNLDQDELTRCKQNMDFGVTRTFGNITVVTPAERSISCSSSSSF